MVNFETMRVFLYPDGSYKISDKRPDGDCQLLPKRLFIYWSADQSNNEIYPKWRGKGDRPDDCLDTLDNIEFLSNQGYLDDLVDYYWG